MAFTLLGGTAVGTVLILIFLPALYAIWFRVRSEADPRHDEAASNCPAQHSFVRLRGVRR